MRGKFGQKTENKYQKLEIHISKPEKKTYHVSRIPFRGDYTMAEATNPLFSSNFFFFMVSSPPISNCITHKKRNVTSKNRQSSKFTGKLSNHAKVLEHINFKMFSTSIHFFFGKEKVLKMKRRSGEMGLGPLGYAIREIPCCDQ